MTRFLLHLTYTGSRYAGFQDQPGRATIQSVVEQALLKVLGEAVRIVPSGRTDKGVHALMHPAHCDVTTAKADSRLSAPDACFRLNSVLPPDIAVVKIRRVAATFHARTHAREKTYTYFILISTHKNPFLEEYVWRIPYALDVERMQKAARCLQGRHDFSSFCASDASPGSPIKTLRRVTFSSRGPAPFFHLPGNRFVRITFTGDGFLKQMVRTLVGTLVDVGRGRFPAGAMKKILTARDRRQAGSTAPAQGLHLVDVSY